MTADVPREPTVRHHVARDTLGFVISWLDSRRREERNRPDPDQRLVDYLRHEAERLTRLQRDLRVSDHEAVERVIDEYGPLVRTLVEPRE